MDFCDPRLIGRGQQKMVVAAAAAAINVFFIDPITG